ncbi:AMP-binding protein [Parachlamydia sp. AcF125]|uniref:AMP-binding protein n=1 Tax=Parachlamydia sp. AcF125 TaxID=2795736 RepID=UPI001BC99B66|nr:AMP-binding protein [Parachlamydia sp. AcF125]MBS4169219.1 2-succinylbenzoate--CoA ligase [Parachlamydia sp. AcF125]
MQVDWLSPKNEILINPHYPKQVHEKIAEALQSCFNLDSHVCVATSGSTAEANTFPKMALLSKEGILVSAQAVNKHLECSKIDRWIHPLPDFHVGGLGIWARSFLSNSTVYAFREKWNPHAFWEFATQHEGTLTSLVPTQLFDLVTHRLSSPPSLRAIVVGGGRLNEFLYEEARALGWNVLPSYGLTECASQVATASLSSLKKNHYPSLSILSHVEVSVDREMIALKSPSLLTFYLESSHQSIKLVDPKIEGIFRTEDRGRIDNDNQALEVLGRDQNFFKIGGESVNFGNLEKILEQTKMHLQFSSDAVLIPYPDERLGYVIHLVAELDSRQVEYLTEGFNQAVLPYEKIRKVHRVKTFPRSPIGKLLRNALLEILG